MKRIVPFLCIAIIGIVARAATPELNSVLPRGAQRGTEVDLLFNGQRLADAQEILFYEPGITVTKIEAVNPNQIKAHLKVAADAVVGERQLRVRCASGLSELRTFAVTALPIIAAEPKHNEFAKPQPIPMNVTVAGRIEAEEVDYFIVDAKKGQRLTAEVQGMRLATTLFDPALAILNDKQFELAVSDDTALGLQDPIASVVIPEDGKYTILVRESSYGGNADSMYLLHVGTFPRPRTTYPLGGKIGEDLQLQFIGDPLGPIAQSIKLPAEPTPSIELICQQDNLSAPTANFICASPFPNVLEVEPNNDASTATRYDGEFPVAFNGIIQAPGDIDFFRFKGKKDQVLDFHVIARKLRSPLDSVLIIRNAAGVPIVANDDAGGPDSYVRFTPPADAEYVLSVEDQLHQGGPEYTYRVEVTPVKPALAMSIPEIQPNSQERQTIVIPRGNRFATLIRGTRADFAGPIALSCPDLPPGVQMVSEPIAEMTDVTAAYFQAAADAPVGGKLCELIGKPVDPKIDVTGSFLQHINLIVGDNNQVLYAPQVHKLAIAVTNEAPFTLKIVQPKVPIVQSGSMELKVIAERKPDFKGPITVRMVFSPPGVTAGASVDMPADKNEILFPLNAAEGAPVRKWKIGVLGSSDVNGQLFIASEPVDLEVGSSLVAMKMEMSAVERGKTAQVSVGVEQKTKFDGAATVKLMGLPPNTSAPDVQMTAADQRLTFSVETNDKSAIGQSTTLFCQVTLNKDGEKIVQEAGRGGVLRIDPLSAPKAAVASAAPTPAAPKAPDPAGKPLSRLEKLRLESGK